MILLYNFLNFILLPFFFIIILIRLLIGKEDISRIFERFAIGKHRQDDSFLIWIHAASVGESMAALTLIHNISKHYPEIRFLVTSWTQASAKILSNKLPKTAIHQFLPIDNIIFVKIFLRNWKPNLGIFLESELWPCTINEAAKHCKLLLVNARISDKSFESWKKRKNFFQLILKNFSKIIVQSERDLQKFNELRIPDIQLDSKSFRQDEFKDEPAERSKLREQRRRSKNLLVSSDRDDAVVNLGNIKFANEKLLVDKEELLKLSSHIKDKRVITFASTHPEDEEIIFPIIKNLKKQAADCYIILIPRHPERVKSILDNCSTQGLLATTKSQNNLPVLSDDLYIVDRFGEMGLFFSVSLISFIGGSFKQGGHNILEAANFSNCIIFGPDMSKNTDIAKGVLQNKAAIQIKSGEDLLNTLKYFLDPNNSRELKSYQENSLRFVAENQKILDEYLKVITKLLP